MDKDEVILYKLEPALRPDLFAKCLPLNIVKALCKRYAIFPDD